MKQHVAAQKTRGIIDLRSEDPVRRDDVSVPDNVALLGSDHELAQLNMRLSELEVSFEKAQRRIERLLGERNQLGALLDKRDEQIQQLNRELGTRRFTPSEGISSEANPFSWLGFLSVLRKSIFSRAGAIQSRLSLKIPTNRPSEDAKTPPSEGFKRPPLLVNYKKATPQAVLAVLLFGLDESEIKNLLPVIERDCRASDMMPLLLTDNDAFELLREHGIIFEYLPPSEDRQQFDNHLSWNLYIQRRLAIIRQKWQPARVIALGQVAADTLSLWQQSPFEETPLPAMVKS